MSRARLAAVLVAGGNGKHWEQLGRLERALMWAGCCVRLVLVCWWKPLGMQSRLEVANSIFNFNRCSGALLPESWRVEGRVGSRDTLLPR
jgi:hypothetical protein